jgi:YVTN family beta-propeller protein
MRPRLLPLLGLTCLLAQPFSAQNRPGPNGNGVRLHNGWKITPVGRHERTGDMLLGCALSPDGKTLAMTNAGAAAHHLHLIDTATGKIRQSLPLERAWNGIAWTRDGNTLYISGGTSPRIHRLTRLPDGSFQPAAPLLLPDLSARRGDGKGAPWVGGLALSPDEQTLYAVNTATDAIYALRLSDGTVGLRRALESGARPYALRFAPDGKTLYATQWGMGSVVALDPATLETKQTLTVGSHPNALLFVRDRLFVSCGNEDAVITLDPQSGQIKEKIVVRITPRAPAGATPNALALSPDGKMLFVANADNNAVAVVEVAEKDESKVLGFIPTGWYPTAVCVSPDGRRLFVGSGKGMGIGPNGNAKSGIDPNYPKGYPYVVTLLGGMISTIELPDAKKLAAYSRQVAANTPYRDAILEQPARAPRPGTNPIPSRLGDPSPIKYVLYIIKENRTYDQVFGAFTDYTGKPRGKGDPNLCLFGEEVTPNHHALAREFTLFDNFYCDGEVSVDGHHWSNGAYVPDFMARTWPQQYSGKGSPPLNEALAATPAGRIWDQCEKKGLSYRTYYYHTKQRMSEEWAKARAAGRRDYDYVDIFIQEFRQFEQTDSLPRFMVMALSENHTRGATPGAFTPKACVASNDVGLGKIVDAISHSKYWKEFAIFVVEDDAQNGPDHVDAHRSVMLAISPYTRRRHLDSTFYTTTSVLRTMELILGLPPMSQYDAGATPLYAAFTNKPDLTPYTALPARIDLQAKNPATGIGARASLTLNFSEPDLLTEEGEDLLNRILWHSIKGEHTPYPGVVRRALPLRKR